MSSQWNPTSQSQAVPTPSQALSQGVGTSGGSPPPAPPENDSFHNPILQNGSGPLNNLHAQFILEEGFFIVSSGYRPAPQKPSPSKKSSKRSSSASVESEVGLWQIRIARMVFGQVNWYSTQLDGQSADGRVKTLMTKSKCDTWNTLQQRVHDAWNANDISFGVLKTHREKDGTWSEIQVIFGNEEDSETPQIRLSLPKTSTQDSLVSSTYLCAEVCKQNTILKNSLVDKQSKLQHARRLAGTLSASQHPTSQAGGGSGGNVTSLVNPGRLKRQRNDDQGFEDDESSSGEEEDEEVKQEEQLLTVGPNHTRNTRAAEHKKEDGEDTKRQRRELSESQTDEE